MIRSESSQVQAVTLPTVIVSSVIRSSQQGESHGGVYLVDLESGKIEQKLDWNDDAIDWEGRGGDRGLRGIALHGDQVYLAASDEIFVYDTKFQSIASYRNRYLKHCHEISVAGGVLYLTSTAHNSILEFNLECATFGRGYLISRRQESLFRRWTKAFSQQLDFEVTPFDCNSEAHLGPPQSDLHLNNVSVRDGTILVAGTRIDGLLTVKGSAIGRYASLPIGTHNATAYQDGVIYNDTRQDRIVIVDRGGRIRQSFEVPRYESGELLHTDVPEDHARQSFARGLCLSGEDFIIGGSSPSTITAYRINTGERLKSINISRDVRNCIHGLEIWPRQEL